MVLKILKILMSLASLAAFVWFGLTVKLGDRTFFGHVMNIAKSSQTQELYEGTKGKVTGLLSGDEPKDDKAARGARAPGEAPKAPTGPPQEQLSESDRQQMRKLLGSHAAKDK